MILYHASTVYHTLCCIVHKLSENREEKACLFLVEYMLPKEELQRFVKELQKLYWFEKIYIVPEKKFQFERGAELTDESTEKETMQVIKNICRAVEKWYQPGFLDFDEYYVAADNWSIGIDLLYHGVFYNYFEDACGIMGDTPRFLRIIKNLNETNYVISNYLGGIGRSKFAKHLYCSLADQPKGFSDERAVDFSIYQSVKNLRERDVNDLLLLYGVQPYPVKQGMKNALFLSQRLPTLPIQKIEVQERMTTLLMDYFCKDCNIIVKPHPKDVWIDYKKLIPGCDVVSRNVPSELLPFIFGKNRVTFGITPNSTSIHGMSYIADYLFSFGNDFEVNYEKIHIYYICLLLLQMLQIKEIAITDEITKQYMKHFIFHNESNIEINSTRKERAEENRRAILYSQRDQIAKTTSNIAIYLNEQNDYTFLLSQEQNKERYWCIEYQIINQRSEKMEYKGEIWTTTNQKEMENTIETWKGSYELPYSEAIVQYETKPCNELKITKGKLKAMEYAIQHPFVEKDRKKGQDE